MDHFSIRLWHTMKSGLYRATGNNQLSGWNEKKLQSQTCTKKRSWSLNRSAAGLIHCSFLNPGKNTASEQYAQQIDEMHQKLQCLQPALVYRKGLILLHDNSWWYVTQPMLQKLNEFVYEVLPHLPYSSDLLPTIYHFFKHLDNFLQGKCFHNQQEAENAF